MKILILGAMGYDGMGLVDSYRQNFEDDIVLLDKRFVAHFLANLPPRFRFIEGNIQDKDLMKDLLKDVGLVYLLAGEVEAEASINKEWDIWENNYYGAINVIDACSDNTHVLFASSGNVFGGLLPTEKNMDLTEEDEPRPKYPYAESKRAVEQYLMQSKKCYTIMRFGTHYGYTPGIRFNLVTNIFMKRAMMGQNITLYGSGDNFRPTLCAHDAIRGMRFLAMNPKAKGEIFHLVGNNYRIREIAQEVGAFFPESSVVSVPKEVAFNSYHLSSKKIQKLGFRFQWDIRKSIEEMKEIFRAIAFR